MHGAEGYPILNGGRSSTAKNASDAWASNGKAKAAHCPIRLDFNRYPVSVTHQISAPTQTQSK